MKIKGIELQQFMDEAWPGGDSGDWFWDHEEFEENPDPETVYDTDCLGGIYYQGADLNQTPLEYDLGKLIRSWRKTKTHDLVYVAVPKEFVSEFTAYCKANRVVVRR